MSTALVPTTDAHDVATRAPLSSIETFTFATVRGRALRCHPHKLHCVFSLLIPVRLSSVNTIVRERRQRFNARSRATGRVQIQTVDFALARAIRSTHGQTCKPLRRLPGIERCMRNERDESRHASRCA